MKSSPTRRLTLCGCSIHNEIIHEITILWQSLLWCNIEISVFEPSNCEDTIMMTSVEDYPANILAHQKINMPMFHPRRIDPRYFLSLLWCNLMHLRQVTVRELLWWRHWEIILSTVSPTKRNNPWNRQFPLLSHTHIMQRGKNRSYDAICCQHSILIYVTQSQLLASDIPWECKRFVLSGIAAVESLSKPFPLQIFNKGLFSFLWCIM